MSKDKSPAERPEAVENGATAIAGAVEEGGGGSIALERRLQALVEAEQGAREQMQAEAERRIDEARRVLVEARAENERERGERSAIAGRPERQGEVTREAERELKSVRKELGQVSGELDLTRSELEQARAGLEAHEETRAALHSATRKLEKARTELFGKSEDLTAAERTIGEEKSKTER